MGSTTQFLFQKLLLFVGVFWSSVSTYFLPFLSFFTTFLYRLKGNQTSSKDNSVEKSQRELNSIERKPEIQPKIDIPKETPEFCFKFKFQTFEEFSRSRRENGGDTTIRFDAVQDLISTEFVSFNGKEQIKDVNSGLFGDKDSFNVEFLSDNDTIEINFEEKDIHEEVSKESVGDSGIDDVEEKIEAMTVDAAENLKGDDHQDVYDVYDEGVEVHHTDSDSESFSSSPLRSVVNHLIDSYTDGFLTDGDFAGEFELENLMVVDGENVEELHDDQMSDLDDSGEVHKGGEFDEEEVTYTMEELKKIEEAHLKNVGNINSDFLSEIDFQGEKEKSNDPKPADTSENSDKMSSKNKLDWDSEDSSNKLETLWEHQELIEQLKMELKKVKATGLPTILEESECPKMMEDLKPWKIEEKFQHSDRMHELHKLYKSYRDRMRKFDILNFQKMYAIGFLQQKDKLQSISAQKSSVPSLFSQNLGLFKRKKIGSDPMMKFMKELQSDLEVVYVGQMCLSWEILQWQYGKALELWESDPRGIRLYNEVAGEFQQFQVLLQRFIEDEPFQEPRVHNFVKSRCVLRNLLQVPVITEDSAKDRKKAMKRRERGDYSISSDTLVEIMEESIRIFWRFVRADKDCSNVTVKCRKGPDVELQDPADSELLMEVLANLQKKEKKLKDLLRSGNCILKRFQKCHEDDSDQVFYFFSQVDMKLVSRVLNMPRLTTDQLLWCRNKLSRINFVNRKISIEPSFLLFPC